MKLSLMKLSFAMGGGSATAWSGAGMSELGNYQRHDKPEVGMPALVSIKFFIQPLKFECRTRFDRANARIKWRPLNSFLVERSVSGSNIHATAAL
jgi:hypothetical protein